MQQLLEKTVQLKAIAPPAVPDHFFKNILDVQGNRKTAERVKILERHRETMTAVQPDKLLCPVL